jgi:hypothetical protein
MRVEAMKGRWRRAMETPLLVKTFGSEYESFLLKHRQVKIAEIPENNRRIMKYAWI